MNIERMNKADLFILEEQLKDKPWTNLKKRKVRETLYECYFCAECKTRRVYDKHFDVWEDVYNYPCKTEVCPYREHFE